MAIEHRARVAVSVAFVASIVASGLLPAEIPPLWPAGDGYVFIGAPFVAFLLPVTAAVLWWLLARLSRASLSGPVPPVGAVTALFLSVFHVAMLLALVALLGWPQMVRLSPWPIRVLGLTVGIFVAATGNQLPRLRRNLVWGVRTPQTLANDAVWKKVHRLAGYLQVATGFSIAMAALLDVRTLPQIIVVAVLVEILACITAGLIFSRQSSRAAAHGSL